VHFFARLNSYICAKFHSKPLFYAQVEDTVMSEESETKERDMNDLDSLIDLVHAAVYRHSPELQYIPIPAGKAAFSDYKRNSKDWDWKQIFKTKVTLIEERNGKVVFKRSSGKTFPAMIKIGFYHARDGMMREGAAPNVDMRTTYLLDELVATAKLRWITLSIANVDLELDQLRQFPDVYTAVEKAKARNGSTHVYVQVLEHYARHSSLMFWLQTQKLGEREWKALLFRLILTLAKLQEQYPMFRHNHYNPEAMEVYVVERGRVDQATLEDMVFEMEDPGFETRICDFAHSNGVGTIENEDIEANQREADPLHDQRTLSRWLLKHLQLTGHVAAFIKELGASKLTPREILLTNRFFEEIRRPKNKSHGQYNRAEMDSASSRTEDSPQDTPVVSHSGSRRAFQPHLLRIQRGNGAKVRSKPRYAESIDTESIDDTDRGHPFSASSSPDDLPKKSSSKKNYSSSKHKPRVDSDSSLDMEDDNMPAYSRQRRSARNANNKDSSSSSSSSDSDRDSKKKHKSIRRAKPLTIDEQRALKRSASAQNMDIHFLGPTEPTGIQGILGMPSEMQNSAQMNLPQFPPGVTGETGGSHLGSPMVDLPQYNAMQQQMGMDASSQQGFAPPQNFQQPMQGFPQQPVQGFPQQPVQGFPQQPMQDFQQPMQDFQQPNFQQPPMGYPQQGFPQQGYPQQSYPQQGFPPMQGGGGAFNHTRPGYGQYGGTDPRFFFSPTVSRQQGW
jgi:hypothetical protein